MNTLIANDIINMESFELNIEIAERVFRAKVISKENSPSTKLLVGDFGKESYKPMRGSWHNCWWHKSEESAWEDCPNFAGAMGEAWKVVERLHFDGIVFIGEIGEDFYEYIIDNRKLPRTAVAKHIGVPKYRLNMYYIDLFGSEAM